MFKNLRQTILNLNNDVNNVANCEKAIKLRGRLLKIGIPMCIIGFLGVFICFVLFVTAGAGAFGETGFTPRVLIPFILFIPLAFVGSIGAMLTNLGLQIVVVGYTTKIIDNTVGSRCPGCGNTVNSGEVYCPKCGNKICKECPNCHYINDEKAEYCVKCGKKI